MEIFSADLFYPGTEKEILLYKAKFCKVIFIRQLFLEMTSLYPVRIFFYVPREQIPV